MLSVLAEREKKTTTEKDSPVYDQIGSVGKINLVFCYCFTPTDTEAF
jgi:hypothetical protein